MKNLSHLDPMNHMDETSPGPLLIVREKNDPFARVQHAYDLYEQTEESKGGILRRRGANAFG
jgi:hypothetical protein